MRSAARYSADVAPVISGARSHVFDHRGILRRQVVLLGGCVPPPQVVGLLAPQPLAYARGSAPEAGAHAAVERNVLSRARKQAV